MSTRTLDARASGTGAWSRRGASRGVTLAVVAVLAASCMRGGEGAPQQRQIGTRRSEAFEPIETIYDGALGKGWQDYGWSKHELGKGPVRIEPQAYGGWIVAHPGLEGRFGALSFRMNAPREWGEFLEVQVASNQKNAFPPVVVGAAHRVELPDDWSEVLVPMRALDPESLPFDRVVFHANKKLGAGALRLDKIVLTRPDAADAPPPTGAAIDVALSIDCANAGTPISPWIYGIAYDPRLDRKDRHQWLLGATARRWGGNPSSRFNWELGNAWNTANDWFFENVNYTGDPTFRWSTFLDDERAHHVATALTVPMIGWVAKDTTSFSYPISQLGEQQAADGFKPDAGNGRSRDGKPLAAPPPTRTSVASSPASIGRWVRAIRERSVASGAREVDVYVLDNEPMLWNSTHRDVHPEPVGYDELLEKTIAYGEAVRAADPGAKIAGPALWGWPAYFYSAKDAAAGFRFAPDRAAHGDVPLLAWWLREVRAHETKVGHRLIDLVDVHFYPQQDRVGGADGGVDSATVAMRLRATRGLWDPTYVDESWIAAPIELIPRVRRLIALHAPGLGVQIGEWNFGAETHPSGGVAVAEALGRFGQQSVASAFYWTYPPENSPAFWAFRAYRDFDGTGGRFLDRALPTTEADLVSIFASRDAAGTHVVAVVLNKRTDRPVAPTIAFAGAREIASARLFRYAGGRGGLEPGKATVKGTSITSEPLAPLSIAVFDVRLEVKP